MVDRQINLITRLLLEAELICLDIKRALMCWDEYIICQLSGWMLSRLMLPEERPKRNLNCNEPQGKCEEESLSKMKAGKESGARLNAVKTPIEENRLRRCCCSPSEAQKIFLLFFLN